jgi:thiosulfate/3-mercaptopyruvate sulfurtransferase
MKLLFVLMICGLLAPALFAQQAQPLLISTEALVRQLTDPKLVLLHVGKAEEYAVGHIAGARFITLQDISLPVNPGGKGLTLELPPPEQLRVKFAELGISDDSRVVTYTGLDTSFQTMTRVVFTLQYVGLGDRTSVLNGGLKAWTDQKRAVTSALPSVVAGKLTARPAQDIVADAAFVESLAQRPGHKLIDARAATFYNGTEATQGKNGHIPGAINVPYTSMLDAGGIVNEKQIRQAFQDAGIKPGDTVVTYCHIGQQATAVIFGARLLGNPVMLYDGSFQDWALNDRGAVEK